MDPTPYTARCTLCSKFRIEGNFDDPLNLEEGAVKRSILPLFLPSIIKYVDSKLEYAL
jgi:hypothetical protein